MFLYDFLHTLIRNSKSPANKSLTEDSNYKVDSREVLHRFVASVRAS